MTSEPDWRKSSFCGTNTCVEAAPVDGRVLVRDSKNPGRAPMELSADDWAGFLDSVTAGDYPD